MTHPVCAILVAGFAAAAKHQVINALLRHQPAGEQWALITPAGPLDNARWSGGQPPPGLRVETVAPGCPCCTGLVPFSTGLTALLRRLRDASVARLLIEGGSEGHIESIARLLERDGFREHVALVHALAVIDPAWLADSRASAQAALDELGRAADSLVAAPWEESSAARAAFGTFAQKHSKPRSTLTDGVLEPGFARTVLNSSTPASAA